MEMDFLGIDKKDKITKKSVEKEFSRVWENLSAAALVRAATLAVDDGDKARNRIKRRKSLKNLEQAAKEYHTITMMGLALGIRRVG
jgi:hypothetical protein